MENRCETPARTQLKSPCVTSHLLQNIVRVAINYFKLFLYRTSLGCGGGGRIMWDEKQSGPGTYYQKSCNAGWQLRMDDATTVTEEEELFSPNSGISVRDRRESSQQSTFYSAGKPGKLHTLNLCGRIFYRGPTSYLLSTYLVDRHLRRVKSSRRDTAPGPKLLSGYRGIRKWIISV